MNEHRDRLVEESSWKSEGISILLIDHYAGSPALGMEYRSYYLARAWTEDGNKVTTVAGSYSHLRRINPGVRRLWTKQEWEAGTLWWVWTPRYAGNGVGRVVSMLSFVTQLMTHARWLAGIVHPDVVVASSTYPLDVYPAARIAQIAHARLVFEVHDLWPLTLIEVGGMAPGHPFVRILQRAEDYACCRADAVVSVLPAAREHMVEHGMAPHRFVYIPNGAASGEWNRPVSDPPPAVASVIGTMHDQGKCVVMYMRTIGEANALGRLLDIAAMLPAGRFGFVIVGQGPCLPFLKSQSKRMGLPNVVFVPAVAKSSVPSVLQEADILYAGNRPFPLYRYGTSFNKVVDYMMAGKPIVTVTAGTADPVALAGCGIAVAEDSIASAAAAIRELGELSEQERSGLGDKGKRYALEHFDYRLLARRFLAGIQAVTATGAETVSCTKSYAQDRGGDQHEPE